MCARNGKGTEKEGCEDSISVFSSSNDTQKLQTDNQIIATNLCFCGSGKNIKRKEKEEQK